SSDDRFWKPPTGLLLANKSLQRCGARNLMSASEERMRFAEEIEQCSAALMANLSGAPLRKLQKSAQKLQFDSSDNRLKTLAGCGKSKNTGQRPTLQVA